MSWTGVAVVALVAACAVLLLSSATVANRDRRWLAARIDALLPQTQCGMCGFEGCRPYARAIAGGDAEINRCPPGGTPLIRALGDLLGREPLPLDPRNGVEGPARVAFIDEPACIGCTKCIQICPVDAILGAAKQMHTVITAQCTGCELCVAPCPVDCIEMAQRETDLDTWVWPRPQPADGPPM